MRNPFKRRKPKFDPDTDPIYVGHKQDPSLNEDELIMHTFIDPNSIKENNE